MWIKPTILVLFILLVASLLAGGFFLLQDRGAPNKRRVMWALGIRAGLAAVLLAVIAYGMLTGQLHSRAPWSQGGMPAPASGTR